MTMNTVFQIAHGTQITEEALVQMCLAVLRDYLDPDRSPAAIA